jgi:hypothetical protein
MVQRRVIVLALGLVGLLGVAWGAALDRGPSADEGLSALERWERLPAGERERLRERFERYQEMSEPEQRELEDRARNLQHARRRLTERLSEDERARLRALPARQREAIVNELLEDELKAQGNRLHAKLPAEFREQLEGASPEEQRQFFAEFKEKNRRRISLIALDNMGRLLELTEEEIRAMQRLPEQERLGKVLELRKLLQERSVETYGLPAGLTPERWRAMLDLSPEEFFEEVLRVQEDVASRGAAELDPSEVAVGERQRRAAWEIMGQLRPRPEERLELVDLPPAERRAEVARRRRTRVMEIFARYELFPPERLEELERTPEGDFYGLVRRLVRESGALEESASMR